MTEQHTCTVRDAKESASSRRKVNSNHQACVEHTPELSGLSGPHSSFLKDNSLDDFCVTHFFTLLLLKNVASFLELVLLSEKSSIILISFSLV